MIRKINGLYLLKCNNVDKKNICFHTHVQNDFFLLFSIRIIACLLCMVRLTCINQHM